MKNVINKNQLIINVKARIPLYSIWYDIYFTIEFAQLLYNKMRIKTF